MILERSSVDRWIGVDEHWMVYCRLAFGVFFVLGFPLKLFLVLGFDLLLEISDSDVFLLDHLFVLVSSSIIDIL